MFDNPDFSNKKNHLLLEYAVFISHDLVCYKFTTAERCSKIAKKFSDFSENISSGAVAPQFI